MKDKIFNCEDYGDVVVKEEVLHCLDCDDKTTHQLGFYCGIKNIKIKFCTRCAKEYNYDWS